MTLQRRSWHTRYRDSLLSQLYAIETLINDRVGRVSHPVQGLVFISTVCNRDSNDRVDRVSHPVQGLAFISAVCNRDSNDRVGRVSHPVQGLVFVSAVCNRDSNDRVGRTSMNNSLRSTRYH